MAAAERTFLLRRPFGWGILLIVDPSSTAWPEPSDSIVGNEAGVVVPVRHADDVEVPDDEPFDSISPPADVEVECFVDQATDGEVAFDGVLILSSGRVLVGDADGGYEMRVPAGRWRVQVGVDTALAQHVQLWLSPAP